MPFNGMKEASFNVLIIRHLLIIKINLENILVPHNFYCTIFSFMDNWHTAWCIFTKSFKFASQISLKDLNSIKESQLVCSNCAPCYTEVDQKACGEGQRSVTFMHDHITIMCTESFICIIVLVGSHGIAHYASFIHGYMFPEGQKVVHRGTWSWLWHHFSCDIYHVQKCPWHHVYMTI
jgi:hypothetical protein